MNNSSQSRKQKIQPHSDAGVDLLNIKSPLLRRLYSLPIGKKVDLIPWFSFGGLIIVLGAGGFWLNGSLKHQLAAQATDRLNTKSQMLGVLMSQGNSRDSVITESTISALTESQDYTVVYLRQSNGNLSLAASSLASQGVNSNVLDLTISAQGRVINQVDKIGDRSFSLAAQTLKDNRGQTIGILVHGSNIQSAKQILKSSLLAHAISAIIILIVIIYLSKILGKAIAQPIRNLQSLAQDFADGNMKMRAAVATTDEVGLLGSTFNILADSIEINESRLKQEAERSRLLKEVALEISAVADTNQILEVAVASSKRILKTDRVIYLSFDAEWRGKILAEAVEPKYPVALNSTINDPCFAESYALKYQHGHVRAISNIYQANLEDCHLKILEPLAVVASLITPVISNEQLIGLLIAHQCDEPRAWQQDEINLLTQIGSQVGTSLEKAELLKKQRQAEQQEREAKEALQRRAFELLMEVDPVSQGDLTVQVKVQEDEIGTIADSYNATIESLRKLVAQVQNAATQVSVTTSDKDLSIQELSTDASAQTKEINDALTRIQGITNSIQAVASNAKAAEVAVAKASQTVKAGDEAMNQTVAGFQEIRDTVAETAKKVKRLGESSQKISKVVNVISNFADQTNLLALNASIEAAHAGEEGRGFAVVADEVRSLARQSAEATAEIEALVAEIQAETNEVVAAMESGTEQVVAGTKLVDKTRHSLIEIADVSQEINQLVGDIASATIEQSQDSEIVSQTMMQVATISNKTASEAGEVSASFKDLLNVAQELQSSVAKFKVS